MTLPKGVKAASPQKKQRRSQLERRPSTVRGGGGSMNGCESGGDSSPTGCGGPEWIGSSPVVAKVTEATTLMHQAH